MLAKPLMLGRVVFVVCFLRGSQVKDFFSQNNTQSNSNSPRGDDEMSNAVNVVEMCRFELVSVVFRLNCHDIFIIYSCVSTLIRFDTDDPVWYNTPEV